ncbi:MAG: hypothetical protein LBK74_10985 [Treponema sp.]|jgi:hypothetical protein|nr:hypothetical protein [Treponema sp.]
MFSKEMFRFLIQVITSWQIIVAALVLIIYFTLVSYVARLYHEPHSSFSFDSKPRKTKKAKKEKPSSEITEAIEGSDSDDLGLEE